MIAEAGLVYICERWRDPNLVLVRHVQGRPPGLAPVPSPNPGLAHVPCLTRENDGTVLGPVQGPTLHPTIENGTIPECTKTVITLEETTGGTGDLTISATEEEGDFTHEVSITVGAMSTTTDRIGKTTTASPTALVGAGPALEPRRDDLLLQGLEVIQEILTNHPLTDRDGLLHPNPPLQIPA